MAHEHCNHQHDETHQHDHHGMLHAHPVVKNLRFALVLNLGFAVVEFIGGFLTNSVAILSDAVHDLGDAAAIAASLVLERQAGKGRTPLFSYGKRRLSILAAFITSLILVIGAVVIIFEAVPRLFAPEPVKVMGVLWLAVAGLVFNGLAVLRLRSGGSKSLNQRAVMLHLVEDVLGWIAVLAGGVIMYFTQWYWIDPLLSLGIAAFILYNAIRNIMAVLKIFLQAVPENFDEAALVNSLRALPGVIGVHDLHVWTMDGERNVLTVHLVVDANLGDTQVFNIKQQARQVMDGANIQHPTLEIERAGEPCKLAKC
ncbi:cation diffusion facilitator family transporter [Chitinophaga horti]|uniref:Cation diffusion facilitator family transporter n=1 Tax=Chitinophaga horti TaxID=2920382 RepID=A0ABY6J4Q8_9BACT|nr:cation diffusion facilitator family transporter [Chitinophaga horti]UYQ94658.1 cation diffusion facilitator family transporter [Chitinophaga horti]